MREFPIKYIHGLPELQLGPASEGRGCERGVPRKVRVSLVFESDEAEREHV